MEQAVVAGMQGILSISTLSPKQETDNVMCNVGPLVANHHVAFVQQLLHIGYAKVSYIILGEFHRWYLAVKAEVIRMQRLHSIFLCQPSCMSGIITTAT